MRSGKLGTLWHELMDSAFGWSEGMKVISPWFGTARLISGVWKAFSETQATRLGEPPRSRKLTTTRTDFRRTSRKPAGDAD
jgi:hypothetical protein